ncbi:polymorphic toxin-type HINT domain-containing protein [Streptomyces sp. TRM49041]|uniref:polymorphic toxin-type HINT domain-containing protein n=1 Tax=Streptomyces sp. TRM49041 TaxID=2603216 RepID=UPI0011ECAAAA|nr:polymorphic toxin-type HINT domain-containing protein [Streptomyces sp. TRM49041]
MCFLQLNYQSRGRRRRARTALRRLSLGVLPLACAAGLLGQAPPARADEATSPAAVSGAVSPTHRALVVDLWKRGGPGVRAAAEAALTGSDDDVVRFLARSGDEEFQDQRVAAAQIASVGGRATVAAAREALNGSPADLRDFLKEGWKAPVVEDERVRVAQIISNGGRGVREAGLAALNGTQEDIRKFLAEGQYVQRQQDERVQVAQILSAGGPAVRAAAKVALNGSPEDIREFLEVGQFIARSRDQEYSTVAQLADQARAAGRRAAAETAAAKDASARAVEASKLAKAAALEAASEAEKAKDDSKRAASAASRAAQAANQAAAAAQQAIDAAQAANNSARSAASAAAQAAAAAAGAANAASHARSAAAAAATDAKNAAAARKAAENARAAAKSAADGAAAAKQAGAAATAAGEAAQAAASAGGNALAAANAAIQASNYAGQSDARAAEARAAAAAARRHAEEANRAASAAAALARKSAAAAAEAHDAAISAANHANAAAKAADEAADQAGQAATAAAKATAHAKSAQEAADVATAAVAKAKATFDLARDVEAAELLTRTNAGIERARDVKAHYAQRKADEENLRRQEKERADEARRLAAETTAPGADPGMVAAQGRKLALLTMRDGGPVSRAAAAAALARPDTDVIEYVRTGWKSAAQEDERAMVALLSTDSPLRSVADAADEALNGDASVISAFLKTGQYKTAEQDYRVLIAQTVSAGGRGVQEAGRAALQSGSLEKYREFLATVRYAERYEDERVRAAQLISNGGPEVKSAARIALDGSPELLHTFIEYGRYSAQRKDLLTATHVARVQQLISEAAGVAATAQKNAAEANRVAAVARKAAKEAASYAKQAEDSAASAKNHAVEAAQSAKEAEASAARAAEAAKTARQAASNARSAANSAAASAAHATVSSELAHAEAAAAWAAERNARRSAAAAGKDADAARQAGEDALRTAIDKLRAEAETERAEARRKMHEEQAEEGRFSFSRLQRCGILDCPKKNDVFGCDKKPPTDPFCMTLGMGKVASPYITVIWEIGKTLAGLDSLEDCLDYDLWACADLMTDVTIGNKLKLLGNAYEALRKLDQVTECFKCFPAGTKVLMGDSSTKNIEDVRVGEMVQASDPLSGRTGARKVTRLIVTEDDKLFNELTINGPRGPGKITATHEHPFWSPAEKRWLTAGELTAGTVLLSADGSAVEVTANRSFTQHARTYNLSVDSLHTYYVLAGSTPVLVHNSNCGTMVLGINEHSEDLVRRLEDGYTFNGADYREVIGQVNGKPFAKWQAEVLNVLRGNRKVAISLKGFDGDTPQEQFLRAYHAGRGDNWRSTEWEMGQVGIQVQLGNIEWKNITFYDSNGKIVDVPEPNW